jgi:hypothetical protein
MKLDGKYTDNESLKENNGGFRMPENYLADFESRMLQAVKQTPVKKEAKLIGLKSILMAALPIAAMLVLGYFLLFNPLSTNQNDIIESELSWDEYASFDEDWITEELAVLDDQDIYLETEINYLLDEGVTNNEIIEVYNEIP